MNSTDFESTVQTATQIQETLAQMNDIIDRVGQNLEKTFHEQEDRFLDDYKKQMYTAQKNLREFTKTHSQAELTKKIEEKERSLRMERERALHATVQSSNKVKEMKKNAGNLKNTLLTVEDEIRFIEDQLILSEEKNRRLIEEEKLLKLEILKHQPDFEFWEEDPQPEGSQRNSLSMRPIKKSPYANYLTTSVELNRKVKNFSSPKSNKKRNSFMKDAGYRSADEVFDEREVDRMMKIYNHEQRNNQILSRIDNDLAFKKGKFEEIFDDCIRRAVEKNEEKDLEQILNVDSRLAVVNQGNEESRTNTNNEGEDFSQAETNAVVEKVLKLAEMKLTAQEKKVMIEEFLSNADVKKYFFQKFTEDLTRKPKALF